MKVFETLFETVYVITKREIGDSNNRTSRRLLAFFILFFTFLWMFFDAGFVGNLAKEDKGFLIDHSDDFFRSEGLMYQPVWFRAIDMHKEFANSPIGSKKRAIWQRALDNNFQDNFLSASFGDFSEYIRSRTV